MPTSGKEDGTGRFSDVWVPVPVRGLRLGFEMNPAGHVRKTTPVPGSRWLVPLPDLGDGRGWGYRLRQGGRECGLAASAIFEFFGPEFQGQAKSAFADAIGTARRENRRELDAYLLREPLGALLLEGEPRHLDGLAAALASGCPWEWGRIRGDARGADPILGF
ncbi:hypothetical protein [Desulfocurvus sp. DL9XJH121]